MTRLPLFVILLTLIFTSQAWALEIGEARHLLGRTNFAAKPEEVAGLLPLDRAAAVRSIVDPAGAPPSIAPPDWTKTFISPRISGENRPKVRKAFNRARKQRLYDLQTWWFEEMIASPTPITETMTLFWHNHFVSSQRKVNSNALMYRQHELLRSQALGNFGDLLREISSDPAMVIYLDTYVNRKSAPNENYARELLELFALGEGHYTEQDIKHIARAFTGWTVERRCKKPPRSACQSGGTFRKDQRKHDAGVKTFFGETGRFGGEDVADILLKQPRTAEFIVEKLWRAFISDTPNPAEVTRLGRIFRDSDYEMKPVLTALLTSDAFWAPENRAALIKSPVDLLVGTVRQFDLSVPDAFVLARFSGDIGQLLFRPPNVRGWPGGEAWITADSLLRRQSMLRVLTQTHGRQTDEPQLAVANRQVAAKEAMPGAMGAMNAMTAMTADKRQRKMARMASSMGVGIDTWHTQLPAEWLNAEDLVALILPMPPADTQILDNRGDGALIRALINDPVYQLK